MNRTGSLYIDRNSIFHDLQGSIKFVMLIAWTVFIFMFMDLRIFFLIAIGGFILIWIGKIPFKTIKPLVLFIIVFTIFNSLFLMVITPEYGSQLTGSYTIFIAIGGRALTYETVFYALTLSLKYLSILPITLLFVLTTHPSRFASSLNRLGISYKIAYAVNIALRYIPDVAEEMKSIINAQEARGVSFNKKDASLYQRMKNYMTVLVPLLISSLNRIEIVSNAMDLRGFGRYKKRTWYHWSPYQNLDFLFLILSALLVLVGIWLKGTVSSDFWYPFG